MKTLLILFLTIFLFSKTIVLADSEKNEKKEVKSEIKIEKTETIHNEDENEENETEENEQGKNKFKIKGEITAYDGSSLTVNEQLIKIDPIVTEKLKIVGKLAVGMNAHVKGKIINGSFYAEEIVIDNRNKNKISPTPTPTISLTPTPSVSPTPTASVTPTSTPTVNITPTPTPVINEEVKEELGLKKLLEALSHLLDFLKNS